MGIEPIPSSSEMHYTVNIMPGFERSYQAIKPTARTHIACIYRFVFCVQCFVGIVEEFLNMYLQIQMKLAPLIVNMCWPMMVSII